MYKVKREDGKVRVYDQSRKSQYGEEFAPEFEADDDSDMIVNGEPKKLSEVNNLKLLQELADKGRIK